MFELTNIESAIPSPNLLIGRRACFIPDQILAEKDIWQPQPFNANIAHNEIQYQVQGTKGNFNVINKENSDYYATCNAVKFLTA
jgi:hypothetical protein